MYEPSPNDAGMRVPLAEDHQVENICRSLLRELRKMPRREQGAPPSPSRRNFSSVHGVAYALALALQDDVKLWRVVEACRLYYWQQVTAPFPWLSADGHERFRFARKEAHQWLGQWEREDGAGIALLTFWVKVKALKTTENALYTIVEDTVEDEAWVEEQRPLQGYLRQLADALENHDLKIQGVPLEKGVLAETYVEWRGRMLYLPDTSVEAGYQVYEGGSLEQLYLACQTLAQVEGWDMARALDLILTGHPPLPPQDALLHQEGQRSLVPLSSEHITLLEVVYTTPGHTWAERLQIWDRWLKAFPQENFSLIFRSNKGASGPPTSDNQRAAWMRKESERAQARALQFVPYIVHE